ncbi:MAG TPA: hypothetical protein VK914_05435, partial [bacterium]|nr:hypothetical protein [bacterium]
MTALKKYLRSVIKYIVFSTLFGILPTVAWAAITIDSPATGQAVEAATNTLAYTVGNGNDRLLVVSVIGSDDPGYNIVSSITWTQASNQQSFVLVTPTAQYTACSIGMDLETWYLVGPNSGAGSIQVQWTGSNANNISAIEYAGVNQVTPLGAMATTNSPEVSLTTTITTTQPGSMLLANYGGYELTGLSSSSGFTQEDAEINNSGTGVSSSIADEPSTAVGPYSFTGTYSGTICSTMQQFLEIIPDATATGSPTASPSATVSDTPSWTATATASPIQTLTPTSIPTSGCIIPTAIATFAPVATVGATNNINITTASTTSPNTILIVTTLSTEDQTDGAPYNNVMSVTLNYGASLSEAFTPVPEAVTTFTNTTSGPTNGEELEAWYLLEPPSNTSGTIVVSYLGDGGSKSNSNVATAIEYDGVNQTTPFGAVASSAAAITSGGLTTTLTAGTPQSLLLFNFGMWPEESVSVDSNYNQYYPPTVETSAETMQGIADRVVGTGTFTATNQYTYQSVIGATYGS